MTFDGTDSALREALDVDRPAGAVPHVEGRSPKRQRRQETFGGREDLLRVYRGAKDLIVKHKLLRIATKEHDVETTRLTMCNLWRMEHTAGQALRLSEFDLKAESWMPVEDAASWPQIPVWPIHTTTSLAFGRAILEAALWKALRAAGYDELPELPPGVEDSISHFNDEGELVTSAKRPMKSYFMARSLIDFYAGAVDAAGKHREGFKKLESMRAGARALRAAFYDHISDKAIFSVAIATNYQGFSFNFYLSLAQRRDDVLRIAQEKRNLLPLLPWINPSQWGRRDIFSRKLWVRGQRTRTLVDTRTFRRTPPANQSPAMNQLASFKVAANWRWLARAPSSVVRAWATEGWKSEDAIAIIVAANVPKGPPVMVYRQLIRQAMLPHYGEFGDVSRFNVEILPALFRLILLHSAKLWKESGYRAVRLWCHNIRQELGQVLDYLAGEGEAAGYPQRNSTWPSLLARTKDWHDRQYIERLARARDECGAHAREWTSALPETEIDGVTFTPLTSSYQLAVEGYEMHHCVGDYDRYCADGNARIFAVRDASGARYTLELIMQNSKPKKVEVRQLEGYCNDVPVPDLVKGAAKVLAGMYKQAMTGRAAKKARKILKEAA